MKKLGITFIKFATSPTGLACATSVILTTLDKPGTAALFIVTALVCWAIENHAEKAKAQVFIVERKADPEPEPGVSLKDLDFGDAWTEPNKVSKP